MKKFIIAVTLCMVAAIAGANGPGDARGGSGGPGDLGHGGGGELIVGTDGTVYIFTESVSGTTITTTLKAVSSTGTVLWTATPATRARFVLSGANLISVATTQATTTTAASSTLTALSASTGTQAWTLTIDGVVTDLHPYSGGTYAIVVTPSATAGTAATRQLVAISNAGVVLWKTTL
jgi:outer membrane protein assembly factor BamB